MKAWWKSLDIPQRVWFFVSVATILCHAGWMIVGFGHYSLVYMKVFIIVEIVLGLVWWVMIIICPSILDI